MAKAVKESASRGSAATKRTGPKTKPGRGGPAQAVDRQLARYRAMRDFSITAEPSGAGAGNAEPAPALPFLVQKHAARRLHYDLRLGWHGVLKSWAVTKGPSYYPGDKRLAVEVEDHPMEYGGFEGTIPQGQYGGGTVMIWDQGSWEPLEDAAQGFERGSLKFTLKGKKLRGNWALVRMRSKPGDTKNNWLLIKERDEFARSSEDPPVTEEQTRSAVTGRSMEEIASDNDHEWNSAPGSPALSGESAARNVARNGHKPPAAAMGGEAWGGEKRGKAPAEVEMPEDLRKLLEAAPREKMPGFVEPQLAVASRKPPDGVEWFHEIKLDGYRIQVHLESGKSENSPKVRLLTRTGLDWTARMPELAQAAAAVHAGRAILDGEIVVLDDRGKSSFAGLQAAFQEGRRQGMLYFAFDLLHMDGRRVRALPLTERRRLLEFLITAAAEDRIRMSDHISGRGEEVFQKACEMGAEGIVSKKASDPYRSGRGGWYKIKCIHAQEFVIGGYTLPAQGGGGIGALLAGYYRDGKLIYAGRCGTGFSQKTQKLLRSRMEPLERKSSPFAPSAEIEKKGVHWIKPELVAQVRFSSWTSDGLLRQSSFQGLREDKPAHEVTREEPAEAGPPGTQGATHRAPATRAAVTSHSARGDGGKGGSILLADVRLTKPEKILDPESGLTKKQLAEYYLAVAGSMLPYITGRPLSIVRCPEGRTKPCFYQKHVGKGLPAGVESIPVSERSNDKVEDYVAVSTPQGLVGLAQLGVLEIHPWGSRRETLEQPDHLIFDLDPDPAIPWETLAETAAETRELLKRLGLESFLKSTGGKGLHIVAPIEPEREWPEVKQFAYAVVLELEKRNPGLYLTRMTKAARKGRIYLDYLRNDRGATAIAPYSPRARAGAPVALPLRWAELHEKSRPQFHVFDFSEWKGRLRRDPWKKCFEVRQSLNPSFFSARLQGQA